MVKIHGVPFRVNLCPPGMSTLNMGEIYWDQNTINVQADLPRERQEQVVWHEILHGLVDGEDVEEPFVRRVANGLYAVLRDNELLHDGWFERVLGVNPDDFDGTGDPVIVPFPREAGAA